MADNNKQKRANRVNTALAHSGKSQKVVAKDAHISEVHLSNVKNGKRPLTEEIASVLAKTLNVRFEWLMGYDDFETVKEMNEYYAKQFDTRDKAYQIILDNAVSEVCLREGIPVPILESIPEMQFLMAQIKDYANGLVWHYLIHREYSSTWGLLDQRGKSNGKEER